MLRVLLAAMVPCLAIGLTGLFVTSIGRFLLSVPHSWTPPLALLLVILIMVGCTIAAGASGRGTRTQARGH